MRVLPAPYSDVCPAILEDDEATRLRREIDDLWRRIEELKAENRELRARLGEEEPCD